MRIKALAIGAVMAAAAFTTALAEPKTYAIDPTHMEVTYAISHLGFSTSKGRFGEVESSLTLDEANPAASKVTATIKVASIDSGDAKRDEHLRGAEFFDAAKHPTITFVSTKVTKTGDKTAQVAGDLTIHGVTKPVVMDATIVGLGPHPMTKKPAVGLHASTKIKRSDYGVSGFLPAVGDDVTITIDAEYSQP